jgi:hypothetical protein
VLRASNLSDVYFSQVEWVVREAPRTHRKLGSKAASKRGVDDASPDLIAETSSKAERHDGKLRELCCNRTVQWAS